MKLAGVLSCGLLAASSVQAFQIDRLASWTVADSFAMNAMHTESSSMSEWTKKAPFADQSAA